MKEMREMREKINIYGLNAHSKSDFKTAQSYLYQNMIEVKIKKSSFKGLRTSFLISYNERNFDGSEMTRGNRMFNGYFERKNAESEIIHIAIKHFEKFLSNT